MSWKIEAKGKPVEVLEAIEAYQPEKQDQDAFDIIKPSLIALVAQNTNPISLVASGSQSTNKVLIRQIDLDLGPGPIPGGQK